MTDFSVDNQMSNLLQSINGIAVLDEKFQFTGTDSSIGTTKTITIAGPFASGFRNYEFTWPSAVPTANQLLSITSSSFDGYTQNVVLGWADFPVDTDVFLKTAGNTIYSTGSWGTSTGSENFVTGTGAGMNTISTNRNVIIGFDAGPNHTLGGGSNVMIGEEAGLSFGPLAVFTDSIFIGRQSGVLDSGTTRSIAIGTSASVTGTDSIAIGTSARASLSGITIGANSGLVNSANIVIGNNSLPNGQPSTVGNIVIGNSSGTGLTTGDTQNICIGHSCTVDNPVASVTNAIVIGRLGLINASFGIAIGNTSKAAEGVSIGRLAGTSMTRNSLRNVCIGTNSGTLIGDTGWTACVWVTTLV